MFSTRVGAQRRVLVPSGRTTAGSRPVCAGTQQPFLAPCARVHNNLFSPRVRRYRVTGGGYTKNLVLGPCTHTHTQPFSRSV
nr:MAG: hypothetical protein [Molluscum contagiosum virus]